VKSSTIGLLALGGTTVLLGTYVLRRMELDRAAVVGLVLGAVVGAANLVLGYWATSRAVKQGVGAALRTMLSGFLIRLVVLVGLLYYFHLQDWVNEITFAVSFMVFFCLFLAIEVRMVQRSLDGGGRTA